ncbi:MULTISPECIES: slipin family protein [unclassified Acidovorax]|uniref:slipin family protein n=1 Tax=unclassified Acidovorax TaxID=2684926 RepID=UPI001C445AAA|nr:MULTISPECIES: slipin family protein [unclassified Acidovorax]MBV7428687.1 slipin family protein [Acidovorax sp. sif0732]MBV7450513.1 slipin family protein [Acidovorax sp. sif0715]
MLNNKIQRITVKKNERALLLRNGDFDRVLQSGTHWLFAGLDTLRVETFALEQPAFTHGLADYLMAQEPAVVAAHFVQVNLSEREVGLRSENGVLVEILPPGTRRLYWKGLVDVAVQVVNLHNGAELPADLVARLTQTPLRQRAVTGLNGVLQVQVPEGQCALLTLDGKVERLLTAGAYAFWKYGRTIAVELVDLRLQAVEVSGQDIMTRDKVGLRLNLSATYRITDVLQAFAQLQKPADYLYRELQFALRAAVGTRTLDELLENKTVIDEVVTAHLATKLQPYGMQLESVGVKDIVLPGEMKAILTQVVQAEKQAQANVIRRREETAATRSLLNTAKVMEDNPVALRMKELETLERVAERIDKISVFGGLDQVLNGLVKMR